MMLQNVIQLPLTPYPCLLLLSWNFHSHVFQHIRHQLMFDTVAYRCWSMPWCIGKCTLDKQSSPLRSILLALNVALRLWVLPSCWSTTLKWIVSCSASVVSIIFLCHASVLVFGKVRLLVCSLVCSRLVLKANSSVSGAKFEQRGSICMTLYIVEIGVLLLWIVLQLSWGVSIDYQCAIYAVEVSEQRLVIGLAATAWLVQDLRHWF